MLKKLLYILFPIMGALFLVAYIKASTLDVVYTDYIRVINSYMPDVYSLKPYLGADILTRLPVSYFERIINVALFSYSTRFDMYMGIIFLSLSSFVIYKFAVEQKAPLVILVSIFIVYFSLNKWEMLSNGTGWVHFFAFFLFTLHYYLYDKYVYKKESGKKADIFMCILPYISIFLTAGPYTAIYALSLILLYLTAVIIKRNVKFFKRHIKYLINILIPTLIYIYSMKHSVEEHAGSTSMSMGEVLKTMPDLFVRLYLKSFASILVGVETINDLKLSSDIVIAMGVLVLLAYIYAIFLYFRKKVYKTSLFPLVLMFSALISHLLVTLSRWIFLNDTYGMSSRYALQFQFGVVALLLILGSLGYKKKEKNNIHIAAGICVLFIVGNVITNSYEMNMAKYRKENFEKKYEAALEFEKYSDKELNEIFQYRHDAARIRKALGILRDAKLNVYKERR